MRRVAISSALVVCLALAGAARAQLPSPVLAGDFPDPTMTSYKGEYYVFATSNLWAPTFRIMRSKNLSDWTFAGAVFRRPPRWTEDAYWAPDLARVGRRWALYYSALPTRSAFPRSVPGRRWFCLGVAFAPRPTGPWRDLGKPLHCQRHGAIDPHFTRDERGRPHLLYKRDGNEFNERTPILVQRLRRDGRALKGEPRELLRNDARWEQRVVEAPTVVRRKGTFYLFYSGGLCCGRRCAYAVGVARAKRLIGPWRKFEGNPILRGGDSWRCPGHLGLIGDAAAFHAYPSGTDYLAGRQVLLAPIRFAGGWPKLGDGTPPPPVTGGWTADFSDDFSTLAPDWEWPAQRVPGRRAGPGGLRLTASSDARRRLDGGVLSRRIGSAHFSARALIDRAALRPSETAGISVYRSGYELVGVTLENGRARAWERRRGRFAELGDLALPPAPLAHLRIVVKGADFTFETSPDGVVWTQVGPSVKRRFQDTGRFALTVGGRRGATGRFLSAALEDDR